MGCLPSHIPPKMQPLLLLLPHPPEEVPAAEMEIFRLFIMDLVMWMLPLAVI